MKFKCGNCKTDVTGKINILIREYLEASGSVDNIVFFGISLGCGVGGLYSGMKIALFYINWFMILVLIITALASM